MSDWAFVVLNWNGGDETLACLAAIARVDGHPLVVVSDNGSTDGSVERAAAAFPRALIVRNGSNVGFSAGNNAGIRAALAAGARWVVLVNNDARIDAAALSGFRAAAERHPEAGVLAGKLLFPDGRVQWAGQRVALLTGYSGRPRGHGRRDGLRYQDEVAVDRAVGALMAVSSTAIARAGLLDEDLFAYVEDVDWSLRIRAAGLDCVFVPSARAVHAVSSSTGGAASTVPLYYGTRNTIVVCERHRPLGRAGTRLRRILATAFFALRAALGVRRRGALAAVASGYRDAVRGRLGPRPPAAVS